MEKLTRLIAQFQIKPPRYIPAQVIFNVIGPVAFGVFAWVGLKNIRHVGFIEEGGKLGKREPKRIPISNVDPKLRHALHRNPFDPFRNQKFVRDENGRTVQANGLKELRVLKADPKRPTRAPRNPSD